VEHVIVELLEYQHSFMTWKIKQCCNHKTYYELISLDLDQILRH